MAEEKKAAKKAAKKTSAKKAPAKKAGSSAKASAKKAGSSAKGASAKKRAASGGRAPSHAEIAERAYYIHEREGGSHEETPSRLGDGRVDLGERLREAQDRAVFAGHRDVVHFFAVAPARGFADFTALRGGDLGPDIGARLDRRSADDRPVFLEERDLRIDDVRDPRRDPIRVTLTTLHPFDGAFALFLESLIELTSKVGGQPAIENEERDAADDEDERDVACKKLRAKRECHHPQVGSRSR